MKKIGKRGVVVAAFIFVFSFYLYGIEKGSKNIMHGLDIKQRS